MNLCSDGHDEVCFISRNCPVCEIRKEISVMEDDIEDLKNEVDDLKKKAGTLIPNGFQEADIYNDEQREILHRELRTRI